MSVMKKSICMLLAALICFISLHINHVEAEYDLNELKDLKDLKDVNIEEIKSQIPDELAKRNITLDSVKTVLKEKCIQNAGETNGTAAYEEIESGFMEFGTCITELVNYTTLMAEIDEASPKGELDVVFHRYCDKKPLALECADKLNSKFVPCLNKDERENQDVFMRIVKSLLEFICYKGGDQIALFIAEKGPECLSSKQEDIKNCINSTLSGYIPKEEDQSMNKIPLLVLNKEHCHDIEKLQECIVTKLESCQEITPANIVESMFRFIKNETICRNIKHSKASYMSASNGASIQKVSLNMSSLFIVLTIFTALSKYLQ